MPLINQEELVSKFQRTAEVICGLQWERLPVICLILWDSASESIQYRTYSRLLVSQCEFTAFSLRPKHIQTCRAI